MITSTKNAAVGEIRQLLAKAHKRRETGTFAVEGPRMAAELPKELFVRGFVTEEARERYGENVLRGLPYETVTEAVMKAMSDTVTPQGILAEVRQPMTEPDKLIPPHGPALVLVLEDLADPGNVGTLIRTAEAAGATGVVLTAGGADPFQPKVVRATMGGIFRVPLAEMPSGADAARWLQERGVACYGAALRETEEYDGPDYTGPAAFFIGNEAHGLSEACLEALLHTIVIPMEGRVESLNAAAAGTVLLYEAHRQRKNRVIH